jgi:SAM-dependent methyltransferase
MDKMRKPYQGIVNIIRFNWHFYAAAFAIILLLLLAANYLQTPFGFFVYIAGALICVTIILSLAISFYVYDLSGLYQLRWIPRGDNDTLVVNISAGFDETSTLIKGKFINAKLVALDFYDPVKHTEMSIKRARKAYPPFPETRRINTIDLQLKENSVDKIFVIFSAHEIRDSNERTAFFKELKRILKPKGEIYVTEHLRDIANFLAYNIGFFHFYSKKAWLATFRSAGLKMKQEIKFTPFISTFILDENGSTP